ncbi:polyamine ABC transporter substrate-binding protein [Prosthecomicrobium pneumaticum]|uniref:Putrescine-binding periplasmic protein n=1 Tax=Prosthecomicrobium pneumaticum TaxID=81895 RepID=A0A7W9FL68_9HYPH|nr:polyamine ABC transporter substrate-binding protein [Prosthecomicrobium pneumaticum]MBB5752324.1 putrescine transport system substrate-binding protein [Prosthecomicrobium pneumaticum]
MSFSRLIGATAPRAVIAAAFAAALGGAAMAQEVHIYNWSDYIDPTILDDFTKETGIKVVYDVFDSNEMVETKMLAGGSGYDIVVPTDRNMQRLIEAGVFQPLDKAKIPNLQYAWPAIYERLATYDPGNQYAVNYMWGTTGIGYNKKMIADRMADAPVNSMDMIFKPEVAAKFADCGIYVLDSADDVMPAALNYLGLPADSKKTEDLEKAAELLSSVKPYIRKFHSSEFIEALANGDACIAFGFSGDILQARDRAVEAGNGIEIAYTIPKEGALLWMDSMVIPKDAPNPDAAYAFINYLQKPEVIAKATNYVNYPNGNLESQKFVNKEILDDPTIYPSADVLAKLYTTTPNDPKVQRVVTRLWTRIKSGT